MIKLLTTTALALALSMSPISPSVAQSTTESTPMLGMMGGGCTMMGMMGRGMMGRGMMRGAANMGAMVEGRLAYLRSALGITEVQNAAWTGYAEALKTRVSAMQGMHESMIEAMQKGGAIERMDARIAGMTTMLEAMKAVKPATEKLYAALNDEQKKLADQLIGMDCGAM